MLRTRAQAVRIGVVLGGALAANLVPAQPADAADLVPIRVASTNSESGANGFFADEQGFFKEQGIEAHIQLFRSSGAFANGIISGSVDVGAVATGSLVTAFSKGLPFVLLANGGIYNSASPQTMLVVLRDAPIKTAADLKGKTIAVSTLGDIVQVAVMAWLEDNGVSSKAVNFVEIPTPVMEAAVVAKRVDAAFLGEPYLTPALDTLKAIAAPSSSIADRYLVTGWSTSRAWYTANPAVVRKFQAAMSQASIWAAKNRAAATEILSRHAEITPAVAARLRHVSWDPGNRVQYLRPVIDAMARFGMIPKAFPPSDLLG